MLIFLTHTHIVLFIDEAYDLNPAANPKAQPIFNLMMKAASEHADDLTIILAGYKDDLEKKLYSYNDGLKRRFPQEFQFDDYSESELLQIWEQKLKASATKDKDGEVDVEVEEELSETKKLLKQVKEAGTAGIISYALWELAFWTLSVPVCVFAYYELVGHMPDFTNKEDLEKLGGEAFAFVNFARFAVPLRIGLALSTTSWIQGNVVDKYFNKKDENVPKEE